MADPVPLSRWRNLLLLPDGGADPCLWLIEDRSEVLWVDAPVSDGLRRALYDWREVWERNYYNRDVEGWVSRKVYDPWQSEGHRLLAVANRELMPLGYVVRPGFLGFPQDLYYAGRRRVLRRMRARLARRPTTRERTKTIAESNAVLESYGELTFRVATVPVALAKTRRRRHWR